MVLVDVDVVLVLLCGDEVAGRPLPRPTKEHHHMALGVSVNNLLTRGAGKTWYNQGEPTKLTPFFKSMIEARLHLLRC